MSCRGDSGVQLQILKNFRQHEIRAKNTVNWIELMGHPVATIVLYL